LDIEGYCNTSCKPLLWKIRALYNLGHHREIPELVEKMSNFSDYTENDISEMAKIIKEITI
jgi:hypothetical protein